MEKLYITEEIANHELNKHLGLEVGTELTRDELCGGKKKPTGGDEGAGHYTCVLNEWVWVPAP